mgnify:CR=1 FL=1
MWKDISGYEGLYRIDENGVILSLPNKRHKDNRIKKPSIRSNGYLGITLVKDGVSKDYLIHRLVAYEFCSPPDDFKSMQVNHKDLNKTNNNYLNLEWVTQSQNMKHFMKNGDTTKFMKCAIKKCKAGIRAKKPVIGVNENGEIIRFESIKSAVENKFNNINVAINRGYKVKGYYFSYDLH